MTMDDLQRYRQLQEKMIQVCADLVTAYETIVEKNKLITRLQRLAPQTVTLNDGREVLAKYHRDEWCAIRYCNRAQAKARCVTMGPGWTITGRYPFYVMKERT